MQANEAYDTYLPHQPPHDDEERHYDYVHLTLPPAPTYDVLSKSVAHRTNDGEGVYEKIIETLKESFNPTQLDVFTQKLAESQGTSLQSTAHQVSQSQTQPTEMHKEITSPQAEEDIYENTDELENLYEEPDETYSVPVALPTQVTGKPRHNCFAL